MKFIDEVKIAVNGGKGGDGAISFRREKFVPQGGPDGGNGGAGGAVIFQSTASLNTLIDLYFNNIIRGNDGDKGLGTGKDGRKGEDVIIEVPAGTQVFYNDKLVADLAKSNQRWIAARGGLGGKGNTYFKSSTNQAPDYAHVGGSGEKFEFRLVLKSVADVGLIGLPNAGKSSLVRSISKAEPKVADYPFTTLAPSLGVVLANDKDRFVVADIPGLIPGASQGKGLGIQFLKHIERTKILLHLIDASQFIELDNPSQAVVEAYNSIKYELEQFSNKLVDRQKIVVFTKSDLPGVEELFKTISPIIKRDGVKVMLISSHTKYGIEDLIKEANHLVKRSIGQV